MRGYGGLAQCLIQLLSHACTSIAKGTDTGHVQECVMIDEAEKDTKKKKRSCVCNHRSYDIGPTCVTGGEGVNKGPEKKVESARLGKKEERGIWVLSP